MKKGVMKIIPSPELLHEMEELEIRGGDGDITVHAVVNCENNTYCKGANCVPQCGCTVGPQPELHKISTCSTNGGNNVFWSL